MHKSKLFGISFAILLTSSTFITPASAYWQKTDYTEAIYIQPSQSAFWVPDTGANATNQVQFGSIEYYSNNKIPAKRFIIPHVNYLRSSPASFSNSIARYSCVIDAQLISGLTDIPL